MDDISIFIEMMLKRCSLAMHYWTIQTTEQWNNGKKRGRNIVKVSHRRIGLQVSEVNTISFSSFFTMDKLTWLETIEAEKQEKIRAKKKALLQEDQRQKRLWYLPLV